MNWLKAFFVCFSLFYGSLCMHGQYGNFKHFNIQEGIIQSQVFNFEQDQRDFLWIATLGGITIFDGTTWEYLTKSDGLPSNTILKLYKDKKQRMWIATTKGVAYFDGKKIINVPMEGADKISELSVAQRYFFETDDEIYLLENNKLYLFKLNKFNLLNLQLQSKNDKILDGFVYDNQIYLASFLRGIIKLDIDAQHNINGQIEVYKAQLTGQFVNVLYNNVEHAEIVTWGLDGLYQYDLKTNSCNRLTKWNNYANDGVYKYFKDKEGGEWLTTVSGGVYYSRGNEIVHYGKKDGVTDNEIWSIYSDNQGNIWFGSNGDGVFRFKYGPIYLYNKHQYFNGQNISSFLHERNNDKVMIATSKGKVYEFYDNTVKSVQLNKSLGTIANLKRGPNDEKFIVNPFAPMYKWNGNLEPQIIVDSPAVFPVVSYDYNFNYELGVSNQRLFIKENNKWKDTKVATVATSVKILSNELFALCGEDGAMIYNRSNWKQLHHIAKGSAIYDIAIVDDIVIVATDDRGLILYNIHTNELEQIGEAQGLSCNFVYSLLVDNDLVWIGTGCGIDQLNLSGTNHRIVNYSTIYGWGAIEANVGAMAKINNTIYVGTNDGLLLINPSGARLNQFSPKIILKNLLVFSKEIDLSPYSKEFFYNSNLPKNPIFPSHFTHLTFDIKAAILGVDKIKYRYQLLGSNDENVYETDQSRIVFTNLGPGKYKLDLWSTNSYGQWGDTFYRYEFEIKTPFIQTWYFKLAVLFGLLAIYFFIRWYRHQMKLKRAERELILKLAEQDRVKQRTAEDFHDEIGNKLTKINLLSSMVKTKIDPQSESYQLVQQLQQQTQSLYKGAKDIIWSLQPQSNYLHHIVDRIVWNAEEMMQLANIRLRQSIIFDEDVNKDQYQLIKMEDEVSRNMILIFKEVFNNAIKYASASEISLAILVQNDCIQIKVKDNGKGFEMTSDSLNGGNGLRNMYRRAERIHAQFSVESIIGKGTETTLILPFV